MRARRRRHRVSFAFLGHALAVCLLVGLALGSSGCARRFALKPKELERVQTEAGVQPLRVYTHRRLVTLYDEAERDESFRVQRDIIESSEGEQKKKKITRNTAGLILKIDDSNGMPLAWVTFDPWCTTVDCAWGFVQGEDGYFRLMIVPKREGYKPGRAFSRIVWKKRRLRANKMASLAEANDVYLAKKQNGKIITVYLDVKKVIDRRTRTKTEKAQGIQ
jgi:hypothetical protein